ncbi:MAG: mucoidy inhibitor MuiA family protein [Rubripirellula sp.]
MRSFKMMKQILFMATIVNAALQIHLAQGEVVIDGKIDEVTVYRDQARIVRKLVIPAQPDLQHIRVTGLPRHIEIRSAFTETDADTNVRSMRIVSKQVRTNPEFKQRIEQLTSDKSELTQNLHTQEHNSKAIEQDLLTIEKLVDFSANKVQQNLDRATLDVQSVTALADFTMERRRKLAAELLETQAEIQKLNKDIHENEQQQARLRGNHGTEVYEAMIAVTSPNGGTVRLVYDVSNVNWLPRYSIRSSKPEQGERTFTLQLDAILVQDSGEPWDDVSMTLSTSTPETQAARPLLTPLRVQAVNPGAQPVSSTEPGTIASNLPDWLDEDMLQRNARLNSVANQRQVNELTTVAEVQRTLAEDAGDNLSDETYSVNKRIQITNGPQLQTIAILSTELQGQMHHVVTPLLSSFAFREAELTNTAGRNLIAGDADVYLDGDFAGRTILTPTATGQTLTIGFGADRKIRTRRELLSKQESVQGGNRRTTLQHRLVITNYHETPVDIRLLDRIPITAKDGSIRVELDTTTTAPLSDDPLYVRMQKPTGVLRWDLQIPAKRFGSDAFDHEYAYSIELDRQQTIVSNDISNTLGDLQFQKMNMGGGMGGGGNF